MTRIFLFSLTLAAAVMSAGCASPITQPSEPSSDAIITKYAAEATNALRELSENTGATRVVTTGARAAEAAQGLSAPSSGNIAGRMGSIPIAGLGSAGSQAATGTQAGPDRVTTPLAPAMSVPPGLEKLLTMKWTGDLESLILIIGKETGWKVNEPTGLRVSPVVIALNAKNRPAFEVLKDVGAIAGTAADVVISIPNKTLTVAYPTRKN